MTSRQSQDPLSTVMLAVTLISVSLLSLYVIFLRFFGLSSKLGVFRVIFSLSVRCRSSLIFVSYGADCCNTRFIARCVCIDNVVDSIIKDRIASHGKKINLYGNC